MISEHLVLPQPVIDRIAHEQKRPVHTLVRITRERGRVDEKAPDTGERANGRIVDDGMMIVVVEATLQRVGVAQGTHQENEESAGVPTHPGLLVPVNADVPRRRRYIAG